MVISLFAGLLLQILLSAVCNGAGILEVRLLSYVNDASRDASGLCCGEQNAASASVPQPLPVPTDNGDVVDRTTPCGSACTPFFRICLKQWQNPVQPEAPCYFGSRLTEVFGSSEFSAGTAVRLDFEKFKDYHDPMRFPFSFNWPGTMSLIVEAWHGANNGSKPQDDKQLLLRVAELRELKVGENWTLESHSNNHSQMDLQYRVVCEEHYFGEDCTRFCRPRDDQYGHHICTTDGRKQCADGWTGPMCNRPICAVGCHPENGHCTKPGECLCRLGYQGATCDRCIRYPGCVHGTCNRPFECECDEGWGGLFCNQDLNFCTHHKPCLNGATCTNTGSGHYTCECRPGYTGVNCENRIETCAQQPCVNGGSCRETSFNYSCVCPPGYTGRHCQISAQTCQERPCENGGSCLELSDGGYECLCAPGFEGANCDMERDPCADANPCSNGGTCMSRRSAGSSSSFFECSCPTGFTGPRCETNINDCSVQPCLNGGSCEDQVGSFKCHCAPGFIGMICQHNIDDCLKRPCANGGTCFDLVNDYRCMCRPGFRGKDCSIDINECESNPCRNGGSCQDGIDFYQCRCPPCFSGVHCEQRNDECAMLNHNWQPELIVPYNTSVPLAPTAAKTADSRTAAVGDAKTSSDKDSSSQSILAIGLPILIVLILVMITLAAVVILLYRRTKRHDPTKGVIGVGADELEARRQNDWNEKLCRQMYKNNQLKLDNRLVNATSDDTGDRSTSAAKAKKLDPCASPLHSPRVSEKDAQQQKNCNLADVNYYKVMPVEKLNFGDAQRQQQQKQRQMCSGAESPLSDSGLCSPSPCGSLDKTCQESPTPSRPGSPPSDCQPACSSDTADQCPAADKCTTEAGSEQSTASLADVSVCGYQQKQPNRTDGRRPAAADQRQMLRHQHNHGHRQQQQRTLCNNANMRTFTGDTVLVLAVDGGTPVSSL